MIKLFENLFDRFTVKRRYFVTDEENMANTIKMIQKSLSAGYHTGGMNVGNCGWAEEPDSWFVNVNLTNKQWCALLKECKEKKYRLVIKDDPKRMYFTKVKES